MNMLKQLLDDSALTPYWMIVVWILLIWPLIMFRHRIQKMPKAGTGSGDGIGNGQTIGAREEQDDYFATVNMPFGLLAVLADGISGLSGEGWPVRRPSILLLKNFGNWSASPIRRNSSVMRR